MDFSYLQREAKLFERCSLSSISICQRLSEPIVTPSNASA